MALIATAIRTRRQRRPRSVSIGRLVRTARERNGLTQQRLAELAGTSQAAISQIERDEVSPTVETVSRIFEAMGEAIQLSSISLERRPPRGGNQTIRQLRSDYRDLSAKERLSQAAELSRVATELASHADGEN
ncbi:MAG: XRE family transcriptional regulator [Solirubrobacterales bacterium]|nr:XRE family transcriptional regulator [Solirubrobacterales bacterium]